MYLILLIIGVIIGFTIMSIVSINKDKEYQEIINKLYKKLNSKNKKR